MLTARLSLRATTCSKAYTSTEQDCFAGADVALLEVQPNGGAPVDRYAAVRLGTQDTFALPTDPHILFSARGESQRNYTDTRYSHRGPLRHDQRALRFQEGS